MLSNTRLQSMTGFAGAEGSHQDARWCWEMRSVNGKGLDIRLRLPPGFEQLEQGIRKKISGRLKRGNLQVTLKLDRENAGGIPTINRPALEAVLKAVEEVSSRINAAPVTTEGIMGLRGVMEISEAEISSDGLAQLDASILESLDEALDGMCKNRGIEGSALGVVLIDNLDAIKALTKKADENPARSIEAIKARLEEQVARLLEASNELNADRLYQEVALLATKADIREEIDRLFAHVNAARALLEGGGPVGRKLDFLAQEFNREANTLCSKSNASEMTAIGLELKVIIDQFREQIQNLE